MIKTREERQIPIAIGLFDKESIENYDEFFKMCHTNKHISSLLNRAENAIVHDRHLSFDKPIAKWFNLALNKVDLVHLVKNCAQYVPGKHNLKPLITAAMARTKAEHDKAFDTLAEAIKKYIADVPKEKYCNYIAFERVPSVVLNDCHTSNNAESEMNRAKTIGARHTEPLIIMMKYSKLLQKILNEGRALGNELVTKKKKLIPYADNQWSIQVQLAGKYLVQQPISNTSEVIVAYNGLNSIERVVNLTVTPATCTCLAPQQVGLPCVHVCAAYQIALRDGVTINKDFVTALFHAQYSVENFIKAFTCPTLILPNIRSIRQDDTTAPNTITTKGRKRSKRYLGALESFSTNKKIKRKTKHYSTVKTNTSVGENFLLYEPSEIEAASKFIDESASQISNMKTIIDDLITMSSSLNNNSTYLKNDPIFKKANVALNNIKSSLETNGSKISKQVGLIKSNSGMIEYKDDVITSVDTQESVSEEKLQEEKEEEEEGGEVEVEEVIETNELEENDIDDAQQDVETFERDNGDIQLSDLHDIVILPDIEVDEEDDEFNLTLMLPPFITQLSSSNSSSH